MADSSNSPEKTTAPQPNSSIAPPGGGNTNLSNSAPPNPSVAQPSATPATTSVAPVNPNVNNSQQTSQPPTVVAPPPPPQIQPYAPPSQASTMPPSFRPVTPAVPLPTAPQFSPIQNPNFQNPGVQVQPPGVMMPPQSSGAMSSVQQMMYGQPGQHPMRMYAPMPNGYQMAVPQGTMPPPVSS